MEELLSRIFATLSNLENPNQGDDSARASFLLEGNSMFRYADQIMDNVHSTQFASVVPRQN